jgi:hypothetical protein
MRMLALVPLLVLGAGGLVLTPAADGDKARDDFVPLYNGKDLSGWVNVNGAPGTFFAKDDMIITTGEPTGFLRTEKQYENFILELEWMHVEKEKMANSGLFIWADPLPAVGTPYTRGIEVQILQNFETDWATSDGDIFSIWGASCVPDRPHPRGYARCLPSEKRTKPPGQWNHYKVVANDGVIKLHVNGKEVSGVSKCIPRKGYLALESEGVECRFRNIRIKELPSTQPKPEEIAELARGEVNLFTGLDLSGWKSEGSGWTAASGILKSTGTGTLVSAKPLPAGEFLFDCKLPAKAEAAAAVVIDGTAQPLKLPQGAKSGSWNRMVIPVAKPSEVRIQGIPGLELRSLFSRPAK